MEDAGEKSEVKEEQVESCEPQWEVEEGEEGWWMWQPDLPHQLEWHASSGAAPEVWVPGQSASSSSGAATVCAPAAKRTKANHGRKAAKSPHLLH